MTGNRRWTAEELEIALSQDLTLADKQELLDRSEKSIEVILWRKRMSPTTEPAKDVFAQALERSQKAQEEPEEKQRKRHPALITADRLLDAARLYAERLTPLEVKSLQAIHHALMEIGNKQR